MIRSVIIRLYSFILITVICLILTPPLNAQTNTVGLIKYDSLSYDGYTLFSPMNANNTYLIDNYGRIINEWNDDLPPGNSVYLKENGNLLRSTNFIGVNLFRGGLREFDWDGNMVWEYKFYGDLYVQHHDIEPLPNGNVLLLAQEHILIDEVIAAGRNPELLNSDTLSPEFIVEVMPIGPDSGMIVWEWHVWDHLIQDFDSTKENYGIVENHPELIDLNYTLNNNADWLHANSIEYNEELDQIVMSCRSFNEIWVIDHSTTPEESAGHSGGSGGRGGDLLYRWGNPQAYRAGDVTNRKLFFQHDAQWIKPGLSGEGNIILFNNGGQRPEGNYSTIDEITTPINPDGTYTFPDSGEAFEPTEQTWVYTAENPTDFFSPFISGAQRLPNGNTLICSGRNGRFFETTSEGNIVWEYFNPEASLGILSQGDSPTPGTNLVFRCSRYPLDYSAFDGRDLTPGPPLELYPFAISQTRHLPNLPTAEDTVSIATTINITGSIHEIFVFADTGTGLVSFPMTLDSSLPPNYYYGAKIPPVTRTAVVEYFIMAEKTGGDFVYDPVIAPGNRYEYMLDFLCGDLDANGRMNILDIAYLINYQLAGGANPVPPRTGDIDGDGDSDLADIAYLINYLYLADSAPICPGK